MIVMKIINLVKCEFKKNFSIKKLVVSIIVLFVSSFLLMGISKEEEIVPITNVEEQMNNSAHMLDELYTKEKTLENEYSIKYHESMIENLEIIVDSEGINSWTYPLVFEIVSLQGDNYLIDRIKENPNMCNFVNYSDNRVSGTVYDFCNNYSTEGREKLKKEKENQVEEYKKLLQEGKYYVFLEYEINHGKLERNEFIDLLIERKVEKSNSFIAKNYLEYESLNNNQHIDSLKESQNSIYKKFGEKKEKDRKAYQAILLYSAKTGINHDIHYEYYDSTSAIKPNAKRVVSQVYHLSFVVMILISILYGGIVSNEHSRGTIKNLISTPVRRWKILLSKFIYLILNVYLLLFLGLIIISICTGIKYGFHDLLISKLLYVGGKVIEVNFYLDIIKNILIVSIPIISYLSILFFFSTVTLNTSLTVGITSAISVLSPVIWIMSLYGNFKSIVYTPFWYFDLGFILNNDFHYSESLMKVFYSWQNQVMITFIIGIILYVITTIIYSKRDIKN